MDTPAEGFEAEIERRVEEEGFELVELERAGSRTRPILRLRIDRRPADGSVPGAPGAGVTLDECAAVSRALEPWLDERPGLSERYVLEVSSPGIERPLRRVRDWRRFVGSEVVVMGKEDLGAGSSRVEGVLEGVSGEDGATPAASVRTDGGEEVSFALDRVRRAHLRHRWK